MKHDMMICEGPLSKCGGHYNAKAVGGEDQSSPDVPTGQYRSDITDPTGSRSVSVTKTRKAANSRFQMHSLIERHPFHVLLPPQMQALHRRALKLSSNKHQAEDLVQATLLKAWAKRDSYKPDTQLRAWLFTILRNTFFSELRKYRREVEDVEGKMAGNLCEEPRHDHALTLKELISAVSLLPLTQRRPVILMGGYGYSQLEAADACGCSVGTIKSRVSRGRTTLNRTLVEERAGRHRPSPHNRTAPNQAETLGGSTHPAVMATQTAAE